MSVLSRKGFRLLFWVFFFFLGGFGWSLRNGVSLFGGVEEGVLLIRVQVLRVSGF